MNGKLYRSDENRLICGVCGGLGEFFGIDPTIVRLVFAVLSVFGGSGIGLYILAVFIIPKRS
ncbi:MAG: PspC domain-containing protein [Lachnospiraceae bacterium]|nr:PspC domain-containing protein [Lachnospiraceae bacterium]